METVNTLLQQCEQLHGHICPGQLLGVRMATLGCRMIGINDPTGIDRKKLIVWAEIDRCVTDAISASTGVRLGRRSLKFKDYGKVAATFLNQETGKAVRVVALDESRKLADDRYPDIESKKVRQMRAYAEASDEDLFKVQWVEVKYELTDAPGKPLSRVKCRACGEGINDGREVRSPEGSSAVCLPCSMGGYYRVIGE